ncbi:DUF4262 domain-containing protein [Mesorhizobium sp. B3-1-3]|uniref:DUF4262 domain-containing protein n=1 Tax=unclassified Mesorhizobium TaxID=325217 RepID=UPI00112826D7|nr:MULTISPECIES: DUF4262 domain-containing protein [unclassified Mesorhizobium]TPI58743.1 DUF4262 domain-containing protein [Mesorhizobium sp. B3-1-8]TPI60329.1 DUF4262 domain-containing protein [Mesorhizobium sp. B3-1-3]
MPSREAKDAEEAKALADIEEYGCHILYVLEEDEHPPFAYSVGIEHNFGVPELVVIGLKPDLSLTIINEYCRRVRGGERFSVGARALGFLGGGFDCQFGAVHPDHYLEYFGWDIWFYDGPDFRIVQLIFPTTSGIWPWDVEADEWFRERQPLLDTPPP